MIDNCIKKYVKNETASDKRYVREMFEYMFKDYTKEKDIHITSVMAGLVGIKPCVKADFDFVNGKVLLIFPEKDFFSPKEQASLKDLFPNAGRILMMARMAHSKKRPNQPFA